MPETAQARVTVSENKYTFKVTNVIDGDTMDCIVDVGFQLKLLARIRVYGIDCPQIATKDDDEKRRGLAAKAFAELLLPIGEELKLRTVSLGKTDRDQYGRWIVQIVLVDGSDFATKMLEAGHAKQYHRVFEERNE